MLHRGPDSPHTQIAGGPVGGLLDRSRAMHKGPDPLPALDFLQPAAPAPAPAAPSVVVAAPQHDFSRLADHWLHLDRPAREAIDRLTSDDSADGWASLSVDLTGFMAGDVTTLGRHEKNALPDASIEACHFLIGNGNGAADGAIQPTIHWNQARLFSDRAIRIRLIGDPTHAPPTRRQWQALDELVDYLRARTGHLPLTASPFLKPIEAALR